MTVVSKLYGGVILTLSPVYNYRDRSVTSVFLNSVKNIYMENFINPSYI